MGVYNSANKRLLSSSCEPKVNCLRTEDVPTRHQRCTRTELYVYVNINRMVIMGSASQ